jgi:hypothetical protein
VELDGGGRPAEQGQDNEREANFWGGFLFLSLVVIWHTD